MLFAEEDQVLVGKNEHQAFVARPAREGDDAVLVRWESTKKEEEVAIGDVKKIDLDAKRQTRGKRRETAAPAQREPPRQQPRKRRKKKEADAGAQDPPSVRKQIERHVKALQSGDADGKEAVVEALEDLANKDNANRTAIAQRLVGLLSGGSADDQEQFARVLGRIAYWDTRRTVILEAGGIEPLVAVVRSGAADGQKWAAGALGHLADDAANQAAIAEAGGIEALVALATNGAAGGQQKAARALRNLAHDNDANQAAIVKALLALVANGAADGQEEATAGLARRNANCTAIAQLFVALVANGAASGQEKAVGALATNQAAIAEAGGIEALVALVRNGTADCQDSAAQALSSLAHDNAANRAAIATALVALATNGAAGSQESAASALGHLAWKNAANQAAIVAAGGVEALVALVRNGAAGGQGSAAAALGHLAWKNAANQAAIVAAGGVEALSANGSGLGEMAEMVLGELGPLAGYASRLQSENASLKRRLDRYEGSGAIDVTQDDDADDAQHRDTGLSDLRDRKTQERIVEVKKEKEALEDRVLCTICMEADAPRTVLFEPCNHFLACASCADALQECPNCRVPITARTSIANTS